MLNSPDLFHIPHHRMPSEFPKHQRRRVSVASNGVPVQFREIEDESMTTFEAWNGGVSAPQA